MTSLFFALHPDAAAAAQAAELAQRLRAAHGLASLATDPRRLHVTLHHLGAWPELPAGIAIGALQAAASLQGAAFEIRFDGVASFRSRARKHPLVLLGRAPMPALQGFRRDLGAALRLQGLAAEAGEFTPHMTLLRDERLLPEQSVDPIAWMARKFVLLQSLVGERRYVALGHWPLQG
ncbi:2'-5' RNA ligase family protein [Variovorax saccharolyticus]|uniref:2'-5' RNA ligase family protein n=1 Tax=Variovorax saccharolyticus TaxID=3053516 RepID=UPI002575CFA6|nr:2'-5' RNA ligase family protein [Variovorax sp. J31P216]MDM0023610.1 2'-5' RNA ligase family protein [Variovorax sp. J31P216]